jgi:uncharacterized protein (UPF0305 family)
MSSGDESGLTIESEANLHDLKSLSSSILLQITEDMDDKTLNDNNRWEEHIDDYYRSWFEQMRDLRYDVIEKPSTETDESWEIYKSSYTKIVNKLRSEIDEQPFHYKDDLLALFNTIIRKRPRDLDQCLRCGKLVLSR